MKLPLIGNTLDERFLSHRLRSTSLAGVIGGVAAILLFAYRFYVNHFWSWDLFAIAMTIVCVKLGAVTWYRMTE